MTRKQPLYPHIPKSKEPLYPRIPKGQAAEGTTGPWAWRGGERAILLDTPDLRTDDMSNVYVVELMRAPEYSEIGVPVKLVDVLSTTQDDIRPGIIMVASVYSLFRSFRDLVSNRPARSAWLRAQGIDLEASVYHYRLWEEGDVALYIWRPLNEIAGVEIQEVNNTASVEILEVALGRLNVGDVISVPTGALYESFRHFVTEHPDATRWLLKHRIQEDLE